MHRRFYLYCLSMFITKIMMSQSIDFSYDGNGNRTVVQLNSIQPTKPTITESNGELISSAASGNQWFLDNDSIPGATNQKYRPTQSGHFKVRVRNNGCVSEFSDVKDFIITAVLNLPGDQYIKVGPNPASSYLIISFKLDNIYDLSLTMFDINGNKIMNKSPVRSGESISLSKIQSGVYLILLRSRSGSVQTTTRFIKLY